MKFGHKLLTLAAIGVVVALAWRWWKDHRGRASQSPDDSLLTKAVDAIAPSQAPPPGLPMGAMPMTTGNTGILPPALQGAVPQNYLPPAMGPTGILPPEFPQRQVVLA